MPSEADNAELIGTVLRVTSGALRPWIEQRVDSWPKDGYGRVEPRDPSYLIWVALDFKPARLYKQLGSDGNVLLLDLRQTRNRWAHHIPFEDLDVVRSLDTCRRILLAVGAASAAQTVDAQIRSVVTASPETAPAARGVENAAKVPAPPVAARSHRRMRSPEFREQQWVHRFDQHVEPLNRLVLDLIAEKDGSWMPFIPPYHGGVDAKILLLYQDPGKMTLLENGGSGFLGCENDDPSAQTVAECLDAAGIEPGDVVSWNAYPWFLTDQGNLPVWRLEDGLDPMRRLLELLPKLHAVVTGGKKAHESWRRFSSRYPALANRYKHLETFHTSGQGIVNGGQQTKAVGVAHVVETLKSAASA